MQYFRFIFNYLNKNMEIATNQPYTYSMTRAIRIFSFMGFSLLGFLLCVGASVVSAAELLVIEQDGCPYCRKFDREISEAYPNTDEGALAPLRRIDLYDDWPKEYANIQKAQVTPTFILVHDGHEIDRLVGYPGDDYFWFLIDEMLEKLPD